MLRKATLEEFQLTLRKLALGDRRFVGEALCSEDANLVASRLGPRTYALVQIGALVALGATPQSYVILVDAARNAGARDDEIVGTLVAVIPILGVPRVVSATANLGLALGYDVDAELEKGDPLPTP